MRAILQERFGPPDSLRLADVAVPDVGAGDVLVAVRAAAVNPYDWHVVRGDPYVARLLGGVGFTRPKERIAGIDMAGRSPRWAPRCKRPGPGTPSSRCARERSPTMCGPSRPSWRRCRPA